MNDILVYFSILADFCSYFYRLEKPERQILGSSLLIIHSLMLPRIRATTCSSLIQALTVTPN